MGNVVVFSASAWSKIYNRLLPIMKPGDWFNNFPNNRSPLLCGIKTRRAIPGVLLHPMPTFVVPSSWGGDHSAVEIWPFIIRVKFWVKLLKALRYFFLVQLSSFSFPVIVTVCVGCVCVKFALTLDFATQLIWKIVPSSCKKITKHKWILLGISH